jgi:hypothetical protein
MPRPKDRVNESSAEAGYEIPGWEKSEVLLRDLGADAVVIETVNRRIDESEVQGRITRLKAFAQENPMVLLGALSALVVGGAVAAGRAKSARGKKKAAAAKRAPAKKASKPAAKRASSSKRTLIEPHAGDKRYIRRDAKGRIKESVDVGRSLSADARRRSKTRTKSGSGDKGDR